ncbi:MAG: putative ATP-dependent RNA helicase ddx47 [Marteilia pararefringens]
MTDELEAIEKTPVAESQAPEELSWNEIDLNECLLDAIKLVDWRSPTPIQQSVIPHALTGKDIIALAETGSGKTGAFLIPVLSQLLESPQPCHTLILTPTRELAFQIKDTLCALGTPIGIKCTVIVGGVNLMEQSISLAKKPHVIIATPGRLIEHLENTKGFTLKLLKTFIIDEADRLLNLEYEKEVQKIINSLPSKRQNLLFSATMTQKVEKIQKICLNDPVKVELSTKYTTVENLYQFYFFIPAKYKEAYLVFLINDMENNSMIVFCSTCSTTEFIASMLHLLGYNTCALNGKMTQEKRLQSLNKFKAGKSKILVATDVASRGLDIPHVDVVLNFDVPIRAKDYVHRVGRTARAGRSGKAITCVTQYDIELYQRLEKLIDKKLPLFKSINHPDSKMAMLGLLDSVSEASRLAKIELNSKSKEKKQNIKNLSKKSKSIVEHSSYKKSLKNKRR